MKFKTLLLKFVVLGISAVFILFGVLFILRSLQAKRIQFWLADHIICFCHLLCPSPRDRYCLFLIETIEKSKITKLFHSKLKHTKNRTNHFVYWFRLFGLLPKFMKVADLDDAPGLMLVGIAVVFIPFAVYINKRAGKLLEHAILLKTDHDLTVWGATWQLSLI